jgi:hypothetical protein
MLSNQVQSLLALVVIGAVASAAGAGVINDGSTTDSLTLEHNNQAAPSMSSDGSVVTLTAGDGFVYKTGLLHNDPVAGNQYTVSAEFTNGTSSWWTVAGGVVGWFDTSTHKGIVLARGANPADIVLTSWDATVPYNSWGPIDYSVVYDEAGTALSGTLDPGSLSLKAQSPVTYQLEFAALTVADLAINPNFTTKIIASIDDGTNSWSDTFYTTLAAPTSGNHAVGYYGDATGPGTVGTFDNLTLDVVPEPASLALLAVGGLAMLRRRV